MINIRQGNNFGGIQRKVILLQKKRNCFIEKYTEIKSPIFQLAFRSKE